jgi:hypothetical protein
VRRGVIGRKLTGFESTHLDEVMKLMKEEERFDL